MKKRLLAAIAVSLGITGAVAGTAFPPPTIHQFKICPARSIVRVSNSSAVGGC